MRDQPQFYLLWTLGARALIFYRLLEKNLKKWRRGSSGSRKGVEHAIRPRPLPRRIWIYWDRGEAAAPDLVRYCIACWRELHPDWALEVLDRSGAEEIVDMSDLPEGLLPAHYADILRLRLLKRFGGVWADATCLPARPLDDWLPPLMQSGFFAFSAGRRKKRPLNNWFLASEAGGVVATRWEEAVSQYLARRPEADSYLWVHHLFEWLVWTDRKVSKCWRNTPKLNADMAVLLKGALTGTMDEAKTLACLREAGEGAIPVHKLTWKKGSVERLEWLVARAGITSRSSASPRAR